MALKPCVVCGDETIPHQQMCATHWRIVRSRPEEYGARRIAMQRSWNKKKRCFICEYTGIELNDTDPHNPFYISFDHSTPGKKGDLKLTFRALNEVKSSFSWDEFVKIVLELDRHFDGKPFDRDIVGYLYWRPTGRPPPPCSAQWPSRPKRTCPASSAANPV